MLPKFGVLALSTTIGANLQASSVASGMGLEGPQECKSNIQMGASFYTIVQVCMSYESRSKA